MTDAPKFIFDVHPQSNGFPVIQMWYVDALGSGAYDWLRTPADWAALTDEDLDEIAILAAE